MRVCAGDVVKFVAVAWCEDWEFDFPSALLSPMLRYYESGRNCDGVIEDAAIDLCVSLDALSESARYFRMRPVWWLRLAVFLYVRCKINLFGDRLREVRIKHIQFFLDSSGDLTFKEVG